MQRIFSVNRSLASSNFQVTYYRCNWEIDPAVRFINGNVTSHFITNTSTSTISFDLSLQLGVDSIYFHGSKISFSQAGSDVLQINFPSAINAGQKDSVTIFYKGNPPTTGFGSFNQTTHNSIPVIWTLSEPYGSKDWWPCRNGVDDKADSIDIIISCPVAYRADLREQKCFQSRSPIAPSVSLKFEPVSLSIKVYVSPNASPVFARTSSR